MAVQLVGALAQLSISARLLGPEDFGVLAVIIAAAALIYGLISLPGANAITTFVTRGVAEGRREEAARVLRFALAAAFGMSLIAYGAIAALSAAASGLLGVDAEYADAALLYGTAGVFMSTQAEGMATLRLAERVSWGLAITVAGVAARTALLAAAWMADGGIIEVAAAHAAGAAVHCAGMFAAVAIAARHAGVPGFLRSASIKVPSDVMRFQIGEVGKTALGSLTLHADTIIAAQFLGAADVGLYRGARQILDMTRRPFHALQFGAQAQFSGHWYSRRGPELRRSVLRFTLMASLLAIAGYGALAAFHAPIIRLALGDEFMGAGPLLLIMILGLAVFAATIAPHSLPVAAGRVLPSLLSSVVGLGAYIAAIIWLAPRFGAEGAAWANAIYYFAAVPILTPAAVYMLRRSYKL